MRDGSAGTPIPRIFLGSSLDGATGPAGRRYGFVHPNIDLVTREIIGAALEVHRVLGPGFLESVYENALAVELTARQVPFVRQVSLPVTYKGTKVGRARVDFIVAETVIVELKAVDSLTGIHTAQGISYLKASGLRLALLINFNVQRLENGMKRVVLSQRDPAV